MTYTIWGKYRECPKEELETTKDKVVAEEYRSGYSWQLGEWWKVWTEEKEDHQ